MDDQFDKLRDLTTENQKNISSLTAKVDIFDNNLDKLTDISLNVSKLLAVHEQRLEATEKVNRSLPDLIEKHRQEAQAHALRAIDRADRVETDLRSEISKSQKEILDEIKAISNGMNSLRNDVNSTTDAIKADLETRIDNKEAALQVKISELTGRIDGVQKIIWLVTGGGVVAGAILSQLTGLLHVTLS